MSTVTVRAPGEGEKYWVVGDHLTFKVGPKETGGKYSVSVNWCPPGGGPPPHMHSREDELFYLLNGELTFLYEHHTFTAKAGTAVYLPKNIPHTFKNTSATEPADFLITAVPSGFEAFVAAAGEPVTKVPSGLDVTPAAIEKLMKVSPQYGLSILPEHEIKGPISRTFKSRERWVLGQHVKVLLDSKETGGNFSVVEVTAQPGDGVPPHVHVAMDEYFYLLDGEVDFLLDGQLTHATPGTFIHVPKGVVHALKIAGDKPAKMADFHTPGGFEAFFDEAGIECTDRSKPPAMGPPDMPALIALLKKHGMELAM